MTYVFDVLMRHDNAASMMSLKLAGTRLSTRSYEAALSGRAWRGEAAAPASMRGGNAKLLWLKHAILIAKQNSMMRRA